MTARALHTTLLRLHDHPRFEAVVMGVIVLNAVTLGLETSKGAMAMAGPVLVAIDRACLAFFVLELLLRFYVNRLAFFKNPWRIFDLTIVVIALVPATGNLSILRALRILRILRLVSAVPAMRRVVTGLLAAIPGMGSVVLLLVLIFYMFSVMATKLFGTGAGACAAYAVDTHGVSCALLVEWFGSVGASAYTLFQVMTLESWSMGIVRPVMIVYPYAWVFFLPFILLTAFTVLNLFIGIIVDGMQSQHAEEAHDERAQVLSETEMVLAEVKAMRAEMAALRAGLTPAPAESARPVDGSPDTPAKTP